MGRISHFQRSASTAFIIPGASVYSQVRTSSMPTEPALKQRLMRLCGIDSRFFPDGAVNYGPRHDPADVTALLFGF